jgi:WD40 repeat protein
MCVAFSPDGTRVVSASSVNALKIWDAATGAVVRSSLNWVLFL